MPSLDALRNDIRANYLPDEDAALKRLIGVRRISSEATRAAISETRAGPGARRAWLLRPPADGGVPLGLRPVDQGGRRADVPCRGAAARARHRDDGRPDPGQDRAAGLVGAFGRQLASIFVNASTWALMLTGRVLDEGGAASTARCAPWCGGSASR